MPEFPDEAESISNLQGTEELIGVRISDKVMIAVTPNELKAFIVAALKTINSQSLVGSGNITVGSSETTATILQKIGVMPEANLPSINLMTLFDQSQFALVGGKITYLGGGSTPTPTKLATPLLTFVSATENSLSWSWTREPNGQTSLFQIYINGNWSNVSTGSETSKQITGLGASTEYPVRVLSRASGYLDSDYATGTHATTAPTGLPTPIAPTVVFDATARTLKFTHPSYPNGIEYRINGGAWMVYVANTAISIGDAAVAANYYEARVKAVSGTNNTGNVAGNTAIAAKSTGVTYTPVDSQWVPVGEASRSGNTITYNEQGRVISTLTLHAGVAGSVQFSSSDAALILSTNATSYDGFNEAMYGATRNPVNFKVQAFSHTSAEINIETNPITPAPVLVINFTITGGSGGIGEVIWLHDGIEWARDARVAGDFTIKSFGYDGGVLSSVLQNGFV